MERRSELTVARRAMACEFSVIFPSARGREIDAGCAALDEVERLEARLSMFREDSDISRLNRGECFPLDAEVVTILRLSNQLRVATAGAFDNRPCRVGFSLRLASASPAGPHECGRRLKPTLHESACPTYDLGAIGKGYAIDRALTLMRRQFGVTRALMQAGQSSLRAIGPDRWPVALGQPERARVYLRNNAMGTSGNDHQPGHIRDPRTGACPDHWLMTSVIAPTAAEADALSTAFFVMPEPEIRAFCARYSRIAAVLVARDGVRIAGNPGVEIRI